jgi:hypothetical protein
MGKLMVVVGAVTWLPHPLNCTYSHSWPSTERISRQKFNTLKNRVTEIYMKGNLQKGGK